MRLGDRTAITDTAKNNLITQTYPIPLASENDESISYCVKWNLLRLNVK